MHEQLLFLTICRQLMNGISLRCQPELCGLSSARFDHKRTGNVACVSVCSDVRYRAPCVRFLRVFDIWVGCTIAVERGIYVNASYNAVSDYQDAGGALWELLLS